MSTTNQLQRKYAITAWFYDLLNYPWERQYKKWRPGLVADAHGKVLEIGVGTGKNLPFYPADAQITGIDLSAAMLFRAKHYLPQIQCQVELLQQDAAQMSAISANTYDWVISTFAFCLMPQQVQLSAFSEIQRILKPGGKFRILEIVYSQSPTLRQRQRKSAKLIEYLYGARFDRHTLENIHAATGLTITNTRFLKDDTYLLIEGVNKVG